jgi:hypothetical protein
MIEAYLILDSAVKRCGKSTTQRVMEVFVHRPWTAVGTSEAALFRKIDAEKPTLLLDEVDRLFTRGADRSDPVAAIVNAGNSAGVKVTRMVGEGAGLQPADFATFCPKILAGINARKWPDTVVDRSIVITLKRRTKAEKVERLRFRDLRAEMDDLRARLARWGTEHVDTLRKARPTIPGQLNDRAADGWEPLLAIAELADFESEQGWAERTRKAAVRLSGGEVEDDDHGTTVLAAIRDIFGDADAIHTSTLLESLNGDERLPFSDYRKGQGLNDRGLVKLLKPFVIKPHPVQIAGVQARGYRRDQFADAWSRYCSTHPSDDSEASMRQEASNHGGLGVDGCPSEDPAENPMRQPEKPDEHWEVDALTLLNAKEAPEARNGHLKEHCMKHPDGPAWRKPGGIWTCTICHPPAVLDGIEERS